ncbi:hypothetical protein GTY68_04040 [Streptomyces sp. SID4926]|nr:hypothetical protein [Streptomyces sp. SID4926]SCE48229.1 hypothetical protein GA0115252_152917 [Streptomyces sp. DfronAA-171]
MSPRGKKRGPLRLSIGARAVLPLLGQLPLDGGAPYAPAACQCWGQSLRSSCLHCRTHDSCQDCGHCAGPGCRCACD